MDYSRVVDYDVQLAEGVGREFEAVVPVGLFRYIPCEHGCGLFGEAGYHFLRVGFVDFEESDFGAFVDEFSRDAFAETETCSRHDGDFSLEAARVGHGGASIRGGVGNRGGLTI